MDRSADVDGPAPQMPAVADFWPDQPVGPRHAASPDASPGASPVTDDQPARAGMPADRPDRVRLTPGAISALALLLVIGGVLAVFVMQAHTEPARTAAPAPTPAASATSPLPTGPAYVAPAPTTQSAPPLRPALPPTSAAAGTVPKLPASATFEMAATARSVTVRSQDLGPDQYRVTLAGSDDPVTAKVSDDGTNHRLTLVKDDDTPAPAITITLNAAIRWNLKLTAGNSETSVDLTQSKLAALELAGGARVFTLALPKATGTFPVTVSHGMNQLKIDTQGVPVRLTLRVGAGKAIIDGRTHTDTKPGRVLTSDDFDDATDRVDLDSVEGVGTLAVDTD